MTDVVIQVDKLSKKYIISHERRVRYATLRDTLVGSLTSLGRRALQAFDSSAPPSEQLTHEELWALRDISFEVKQSERLGIIGRNGAGKSTLLKILSRITDPTRGRVTIRGRVASLLEVGTGFHPELTGRENIFLNGAILGMSKSEIRQKFDEIVVFSEMEKFLDTPLKRYSSGMQVRLAFAVAAHLDPEILVVDEVLAVGDFPFQRKCLGKMQDVARGGRTVLFVSHDMGAINTLCEKALLLHDGSIVMMGSTREVVTHYLDGAVKLYSPIRSRVEDRGEFRLIRLTIMQAGKETQTVDCQEPFIVGIEYEIVRVVRNSRLFLILRNNRGETVISSSDYDQPDEGAIDRRVGMFRTSVTVPGKLLKIGTLYGTIGADVRGERVLFADVDAFQFDVVDSRSDALSERHQRDSVMAPLLSWKTVPVRAERECRLGVQR